ncbi:unnamed protein product [Heligmosomoides polygyrus]|uniref:Transposase n=1 Tax=Heligmosomoides polygyrus TaxID=6339 RepID=A0A183G027_HELPZ|nr:unnamed protein product [Heligmosomoides polygyrus]
MTSEEQTRDEAGQTLKKKKNGSIAINGSAVPCLSYSRYSYVKSGLTKWRVASPEPSPTGFRRMSREHQDAHPGDFLVKAVNNRYVALRVREDPLEHAGTRQGRIGAPPGRGTQ